MVKLRFTLFKVEFKIPIFVVKFILRLLIAEFIILNFVSMLKLTVFKVVFIKANLSSIDILLFVIVVFTKEMSVLKLLFRLFIDEEIILNFV